MQPWSHEMSSLNHLIALKFDRHFSSIAAEAPVKFQSGRTILNINLAGFEAWNITISSLITHWNGPQVMVCLLDITWTNNQSSQIKPYEATRVGINSKWQNHYQNDLLQYFGYWSMDHWFEELASYPAIWCSFNYTILGGNYPFCCHLGLYVWQCTNWRPVWELGQFLKYN